MTLINSFNTVAGSISTKVVNKNSDFNKGDSALSAFDLLLDKDQSIIKNQKNDVDDEFLTNTNASKVFSSQSKSLNHSLIELTLADEFFEMQNMLYQQVASDNKNFHYFSQSVSELPKSFVGSTVLGNNVNVETDYYDIERVDSVELSFYQELSVRLFDVQVEDLLSAEFRLTNNNDGETQLTIWVPLTSIGTGKLALAESIGNNNAVSRVAEQLDAFVGKQAASASSNSSRKLQIEFNYSDVVKSNVIKSSQINAVNRADTSTAFEMQRRAATENTSLASQASGEWLNKKFTFIQGEDGVSIWLRDYQSDEEKSLEQLSRIKEFLENKVKVKLIGFNGKVVFTHNNVNKGGNNAS